MTAVPVPPAHAIGLSPSAAALSTPPTYCLLLEMWDVDPERGVFTDAVHPEGQLHATEEPVTVSETLSSDFYRFPRWSNGYWDGITATKY
jgi:hypothetical protein